MRMLVLASRSPRRKEILERAGIEAVIRVSDVAEERQPSEAPLNYVCRLAAAKAHAVSLADGEVVLGADTVVVLGDQILEKPRDRLHAADMLRLLSGREHRVITGICLRHSAGSVVGAEETIVRFAALSEIEIRDYVASGEPMDKAGAYAIQGLASKFVERIEGCYFNVVGLPISLIYKHLKRLNLTSAQIFA
ncbi:MAG: Maf family protein [Bryobacteraceae bacterium]